jgi:hypothetical protein
MRDPYGSTIAFWPRGAIWRGCCCRMSTPTPMRGAYRGYGRSSRDRCRLIECSLPAGDASRARQAVELFRPFARSGATSPNGGFIMLRAAFLVGAIAASLCLPTTTLLARGGGGHGGGGHGGGGGRGGAVHVGGMHVGGGGMNVGGARVRVGGGPGVRVGGGGRRFWHGRWYAYGVGPCWQLAPGGYVWVCG